MRVEYEDIFRLPPYASPWRAITGDWPDSPWVEHRARHTTRRDRLPWRLVPRAVQRRNEVSKGDK
jgi:hypothetical protein